MQEWTAEQYRHYLETGNEPAPQPTVSRPSVKIAEAGEAVIGAVGQLVATLEKERKRGDYEIVRQIETCLFFKSKIERWLGRLD